MKVEIIFGELRGRGTVMKQSVLFLFIFSVETKTDEKTEKKL